MYVEDFVWEFLFIGGWVLVVFEFVGFGVWVDLLLLGGMVVGSDYDLLFIKVIVYGVDCEEVLDWLD